ncbi:MAG: hypothetical protein QM660_11660 [Dysgonomonas sp.]
MNNLFYKTIFAILVSFIFMSCGTPLQTGMKQVQLGMNKQEVVAKLGNDYKIISMVKVDEGDLEILRYTTYGVLNPGDSAVPTEYYILHFLNDKLVEMHHEDARHPAMPHHPHPHP